MSAAVIGLGWLQVSLIGSAIQVNEEKFEKNVFNALNSIRWRLEHQENQEIFNYAINGFATNYLQTEIDQNAGALSIDIAIGEKKAEMDQINRRDQLLDFIIRDLQDPCPCAECVANRDQAYRQLLVYYNKGMQNIPLAERIDPQHLSLLLQQELSTWGIKTEFKHGVYSKAKESFIIVDDHYVVEQPREVPPAYRPIFASEYRVDLFPNERSSPGLLMVYFPAKTSFVWRSMWPNLLGSISFSLLILFCFGYTINVIFTQKKVSEMKTDFINNMTHEFKTPIATISLAADSITSPMISNNPDKVARFANIIKQENKRMNSQVEKVLQMALLDKRDFSLKLTDINLHSVIERAVENISLQVEKKDGIAKAELNATNPVIEGDMTHISNLINNLLDNANKYSPDKPEITVYTRNVTNGVEVTVEDKGVGMNKEARKHIFDKFYRVHTGDLHDVKGFGLGLSYVKAMVTAHKGTIDVTSELGKGSSFILFFPHRVSTKFN